jgi:pantetheine-phosphate adenylyltransferase
VNAGKGPAFTVEERASLLKGEIADARNGFSAEIEVVTFDSLLMHFAEQMKAKVIIRGLRAVSDFDYEFQMTGMNARLNPDIETVFLMASERSQFISSRFVKEIHKLGGDVGQFVSPRVIEALKGK